MKDIFEIRIHGRGGQGAKTAAQFIAEAAIEKGKFVQAFPEYGPERAGAPVKAFVRISDKPIHSFAPVVHPDVVMVIDTTLLEEHVNVIYGLSEQDILIVNTPFDAKWVEKETGFKGKCITVDATKIALRKVGQNLPNTPMIGALIKATNCIRLEAIEDSIKKKFLSKIGEHKTQATIESVKEAYQST